jgi:hypothetical protein
MNRDSIRDMADRRNEKIPRPHGTLLNGNAQHFLEYCAGGDTTCMIEIRRNSYVSAESIEGHDKKMWGLSIVTDLWY